MIHNPHWLGAEEGGNRGDRSLAGGFRLADEVEDQGEEPENQDGENGEESSPMFAKAYAALSAYPWFPPNKNERLLRMKRLGGT